MALWKMVNTIFSNSRRVPVGNGKGRSLMEDQTVTCSKFKPGFCQLSLHLHVLKECWTLAHPTLRSNLETKGFGRKTSCLAKRQLCNMMHNLSFKVYFCCAPSREGRKKEVTLLLFQRRWVMALETWGRKRLEMPWKNFFSAVSNQVLSSQTWSDIISVTVEPYFCFLNFQREYF